MLNVALDTHPLYTARGGVARYVRGLRQGLAEAVPEVRVSEVVWPVSNLDFGQPRRACRTAWRELGWARWVAPRRLRASGAALLHATALPLWVPEDRPWTMTLHDLAVLRHPERFRAWQRRRAGTRLRWAAGAARVVCVSRFTADEAMALLGWPARKLEVVPHGFTPSPGGGALPPGCPPEFFLSVGALEPGKNLALLAAVWAAASAAGRSLPPLVVVGERWAGVARETARPDWVYAGTVDDATLGALYEAARALVFPSLYEGFGLPVLEAMAAGCPVVAAPVASLPEVGGDAVRWVPHEVATWVEALGEVARDDEATRQRVAAGRRRAAEFSWARCARATAAVWGDVAAG